jgi:hypothetical protein
VKDRGRRAGFLLLLAGTMTISCGKEGPPLPPLVRLPAAPADLTAERRGSSVEVHLVVPSANTDGTRPADVERVDVYAITTPAALTDEQLLKQATRIGSVDVKAPPDPDDAVEPDEPVADTEEPEGPGLDQGAPASFSERLLPESFEPVDASDAAGRPTAHPLAGPASGAPVRVYAGVGISTRGRRGPFSPRRPVPLVPSPPVVARPQVAYDETAIAVTWAPIPARRPVQEPAADGLLPARFVGLAFPATAYNVYEVHDAAQAGKDSPETRLTKQAVEEARYADQRMDWGSERCYQVRVVQTYDGLSLEGDPSPAACVTPLDTFPPKAPINVQVVPSEGAISLIWQRGDEKDLAGFVVLRAAVPSGTLAPVTPAPIPETAFTDKVAPGTRYVYAVQAVDVAGNVSAPSSRSEEMEAR